MGFIKLRSF